MKTFLETNNRDLVLLLISDNKVTITRGAPYGRKYFVSKCLHLLVEKKGSFRLGAQAARRKGNILQIELHTVKLDCIFAA